MLVALVGSLIGIWLIIQSQGPVNATTTLIFGIAVAVLCVVELLLETRPYWRR